MNRHFIAPFIATSTRRAALQRRARRRAARLLPLLVGGATLCAPVALSSAQAQSAQAQSAQAQSTQAQSTQAQPAFSKNGSAGAASVIAKAAPIRLAQLEPNSTNDPAATPPEAGPQGLEVPIGPDQPNVGTPAAPPPDTSTNPPAVPAPGGGIVDTSPDGAPIIGDVRAAEGREITDVRVVGSRVVPADTILGQVRLQRGAAFSSRQAEVDRARIGQLGFFASVQVQVTPDLADPSKVTVTYIVIENRVITAFKFAGNTALKTEDLVPVVTSKIGSVLNANTVKADVTAVEKAYRDKGFAVQVQSAQQDPDGTLVFGLAEAKISKIEIVGLKKTSESLVRRQIRVKPGDTFNSAKLRLDLNRLYDTNFFDSVEPKPEEDPNQPGGIIVTLVFREKRTGQFSVGVGFDSRSKLSGFFTLSENNLRGSGQRGFASIEVGAQRNFELGTGNPFIGEKNASYDASIYRRSIYRDTRLISRLLTTNGGNTGTGTGTGTNTGTGTANNINLDSVTFEEQRQGGRFNFTRPLDYDRRRTLIFGYRNERARFVQRDNSTLFGAGGNGGTTTPNDVTGTLLDSRGTISAASVGFLHDSRDLRIDPSSGGRESFVVEQAVKFLGNTTFTKLDVDVRRFIPVIRGEKLGSPARLVLAGRGVVGRSLNQLPTFEQYYIGGTETVRGYNTEQQYGDNQAYANLELRYRFQPRITGVLFVDSGTAYGGRISTNSSPSFLTSFGLGVRLVSPIGPIRLDYGIGRDGGRTHFGIGSTF